VTSPRARRRGTRPPPPSSGPTPARCSPPATNAYDSGTAGEFADCYGPSWGAYKARTRPAPGNHDYNTSGASGYFGFFGAAAGDPAQGYYSYDLGAWHIVSLNSNCDVVSCSAGSAQEQWLRADLMAHPTACVAAYWHHPRYSSGTHHGSSDATQALWQVLYDADADLILAGHEHNYERFAPMTATGSVDGARGIRSFVVGDRRAQPLRLRHAGDGQRGAQRHRLGRPGGDLARRQLTTGSSSRWRARRSVTRGPGTATSEVF
jgi:hypothetical protein